MKKKPTKSNQLSQGKDKEPPSRALVNSPSSDFADEPTSLHSMMKIAKSTDLLSHVAIQNNSALVVTHDGRLKSKELDTIVLH
ncbi:MAG: hypothetical protein R2766_01415 [Saprospiraceae bacterium]